MTSARAHPLTNYWTIGFTGHRHLKNPDAIAKAIGEELRKIRADVVGDLAAISSIAIGADTLFAEEVLRAGIKWIALLPFPEDDFKLDAKLDEHEPEAVWMKRWERSAACLKSAVVVDIWSPVVDRAGPAYNDVGINTVDECDILFAVWDGKEAAGKGGTGDIVAYARAQGKPKPIVWIHAETAEAVRENFPSGPFRDEVYASISCWTPAKPKGSTTGVEDFFLRADDFANVNIPKLRNLEIRVIIYNLVAAFVVGVTLALHSNAVDWVTISLFAVAAGFFAAVSLQRSRRKETSCEARLIAEFCRSLLATWDFPDRLTDLYRGNVPRLKHLMRSLLWNRDIEKKDSPAKAAGQDLADFAASYISYRLENPDSGQIDYYRGQRHKSEPRVLRYGWAAFAASAAAVLAAFVLEIKGLGVTDNPLPMFSSLLLGRGSAPIPPFDSPTLNSIGIAAPLVASLFTALLTVNEHKRRSARYREMEHFLRDAKLRLSHVATQRAIRRVIIETETALLGENYQWYYYAIDSDDRSVTENPDPPGIFEEAR